MEKIVRKEYLQFIYGRRGSGVTHHSPEKIIELFHRAEKEAGSLSEVTQYFLGALDGELGYLNDNDLKNIRYTIIGCSYFLCNFLIERHVDPELAYNSTDFFIYKADEICSMKDAKELFNMIGELSIELIQNSRPSYGYLTNRSIHYIEQQLYSSLRASDVSNFMGISLEHLNAHFRRDTGTTVYQYIQLRKLQEAQELLKYTNFPLAQIAQTLGFSSSAHFSAAFRKHFGFTPSQCRQSEKEGRLLLV